MRIRELFDYRLLKFMLVGIANTLFSAATMFLLYNLAHLGYWGSSAISYVLGSILSFVLNFTFQNKDSVVKTGVKFALNVAICYVVAYSIAQPAVNWMLSSFSLEQSITDQISMLFGMCLFTGLNYLGQRLFAFKKDEEIGKK